MKQVPFTIICPEIKPGQGTQTREIIIQVKEEHGENIMLPEEIERIETIKMQMMLTRITDCIRELYAANQLAQLLEIMHWTQATLTALNVGDVRSGSALHLKLREIMIAYRKSKET